MTGLPLGEANRCQYGVSPVFCGRWATTKRQRPNGGEMWDVCDQHAAFLDRLRARKAAEGMRGLMPAYLVQLPMCQKCGKPATQKLMNTWNAPLGEFCDRHADAALKEWRREEAQTTAPPSP